MINDDNAVTRIAKAVARLGAHEFPMTRTATVDAFLAAIDRAHRAGVPGRGSRGLGRASSAPSPGSCNATLRNTANPTMLQAGYKANVIPSTAHATVDCRVLPGSEDTFREEVARIVGDGVSDRLDLAAAAGVPVRGRRWSTAMKAALEAEDPDGRAVPYMLSGGTDNKAFHRLGIAGYGFSPLRLPAGPGLHRAVPRGRRAGPGRRPHLRHPGAGPAAADLLSAAVAHVLRSAARLRT